jgi:hypothetical protein
MAAIRSAAGRSPFAFHDHLSVVEAHMDDLQQLEIECPFCGETQPRETARWDERGLGYITICQTCGKMFSGLTLVSAYIEYLESPNPQR